MGARSVVLCGSTGSIGTQAVDIVSRHPDELEITALSAGGSNLAVLAEQAVTLGVRVVAVADERARTGLVELLGDRARSIDVLAGPDASATVAASGADVVLNGITGSIGLATTLAALGAGSTLALANKESLVAGGALVRAAALRPDQIVPVDSEHSAIAQALRSGRADEVRRLVLTASGGPFRGWTRAQMAAVTAEQALAHPTWAMGPVVTVNSASMMNKALELIEAHLLFDVPVEDIAVVVHPQSVVHSMVEFRDGSTLAQASPPDMRLPIALGLSWPGRMDDVAAACDWTQATSWTFEPLDDAVFTALDLARDAVRASATHPAVMNAANEVGVEAFLAGRAGFLDILDTVHRVVDEHTGVPASQVTLSTVLETERWARARAQELLSS